MKLIKTPTVKVPSLAVGNKVRIVFGGNWPHHGDYTLPAVVTKVNTVTFEAELTSGEKAGTVYRIRKDDTHEYKMVKAKLAKA